MGGVIQFPKKRSQKLEAEQSKRVLFALTAFSLFFVFATLNEQILSLGRRPKYVISDNHSEVQFRNIASVGNDNLTWEKEVLNRIKYGARSAGLAGSLSPFQHFSVVALGGKYGIESEGGKVKNLRYIASQSDEGSEAPSRIEMPSEFLMKYRGLLVKSEFNQALITKDSDGEKIFELLSDSKHVGTAKFSFDSKGRLLALVIE